LWQVLFYCHFPDKLLTQRASLLKRLYRAPLDWIEQFTTGCAHTLFVNSQFTADTFRRAFPSLAHRELLVLHPSINFSKYTEVYAPFLNYSKRRLSCHSIWQFHFDFSTTVSESVPQIVFDTLNPAKTRRALFVSINRFERKKNIGLSIQALSLLPRGAAQLVIAGALECVKVFCLGFCFKPVCSGGYDSRVAENVEHYAELVALAAEHGLTVSNYPICDAEVRADLQMVSSVGFCFDLNHPLTLLAQVVFLRSFDDVQRNFLLTRATAVVYTPENEHFGIVPVEAMYMRRPVIACASGGPIETVGTDRQRGFLCTSERDFAAAMRELVDDRQGAKAAAMGHRAREAMLSLFAFDAFAAKLNAAVVAQLDERRRQSASGAWRMLLNLVVGTMLSWALAGWLCKCGARST
jgi:alpha-1,3/alpha-1,6-mannosyltransferase